MLRSREFALDSHDSVRTVTTKPKDELVTLRQASAKVYATGKPFSGIVVASGR